MIDTTIFERHLDLRPLRGRHRGLTHCPFHGEDRHPSFSVDLSLGVFNCFGCGVQGGVRQFRELVGEGPAPRVESGPPESELECARRLILRLALAQDARRAAWMPWWAANDAVRRGLTAVREARRWAQILGEGHQRTWPLLALAAPAETEALDAEAQLDQLLEEGRLQLDAADAVEPLLRAVAGRGR